MGVLAVLAVYESALALGALSIGDVPGEDAPGAGLASAVGLLALLAGGVTFASVALPQAIDSFVIG